MSASKGKPKNLTGPILSVSEALEYARRRHPITSESKPKDHKNFAESFSKALATLFARKLRPAFKKIIPADDGSGQESRARSSRGFKKLDVNYSTSELGMALGVSIKTVNTRDPETKRYTKNYSRQDNEFRAEATDYHRRQPYAVLVGVLFMPLDSCDDAATGKRRDSGVSSFGAAVRYFRPRTGRAEHDDDQDRFEKFYVAMYSDDDCRYFDVARPPPRNRRPTSEETQDLDGVISSICEVYYLRNSPPFKWAE